MAFLKKLFCCNCVTLDFLGSTCFNVSVLFNLSCALLGIGAVRAPVLLQPPSYGSIHKMKLFQAPSSLRLCISHGLIASTYLADQCKRFFKMWFISPSDGIVFIPACNKLLCDADRY